MPSDAQLRLEFRRLWVRVPRGPPAFHLVTVSPSHGSLRELDDLGVRRCGGKTVVGSVAVGGVQPLGDPVWGSGAHHVPKDDVVSVARLLLAAEVRDVVPVAGRDADARARVKLQDRLVRNEAYGVDLGVRDGRKRDLLSDEAVVLDDNPAIRDPDEPGPRSYAVIDRDDDLALQEAGSDLVELILFVEDRLRPLLCLSHDRPLLRKS